MDEDAIRADELRKVSALLCLTAKYLRCEDGRVEYATAVAIEHIAAALLDGRLEDITKRTWH